MSIDARIQQMQGYFAGRFTALLPKQIVWDSVPNTLINKNEAWISVYIDPNIANFTSLGASQRVRHEGFFIVQIFTAKDAGSKEANTIAEAVAAAIEGQQLPDGVIFGESIINRVGTNQGYYQVNVLTTYRYTDIRN